MEITEKLLMDAGGWQAMKHARALFDMKRVISANYTPPLLKGFIRDGDIEYRAGLKILTRSNIENICTCRESRDWGTLCAHSLAVGLAICLPKTLPPPSATGATGPVVAAPPPDPGPSFSLDDGIEIALYVIVSPNFATAFDKGSKGQITVGFEATCGGKRSMLSALDKRASYRCSSDDLKAIQQIKAINNGEVVGMALLEPNAFLKLLHGLVDHPRITLEKRLSSKSVPNHYVPRSLWIDSPLVISSFPSCRSPKGGYW